MNEQSDINEGDNQIKPGYIASALILLNLMLGLIVFLFPRGDRQLLGMDFQFVSPYELTHPDTVVYVNPDSVLADVSVVDTNQMNLRPGQDSLEVLLGKLPEFRRIQYDKTSKDALLAFFKALHNTELTGDLIRILHYGDSQLEGDRISDYFRNRMQLRFGGYGPGIILPIDVSRSRVSIRQSESRDWKKFAIYGKRSRLENKYYGIGGSTYRFEGSYSEKIGVDTVITKVYRGDTTYVGIDSFTVKIDSSAFVMDTVYVPIYETREVNESWLTYRNATRSYPRVRHIKQARLLYGAEEAVIADVKVDGAAKTVVLHKAMPFSIARLSGEFNKGITVSFKPGLSPYIYGIALDGDSGVAVDNFPMRGSSGLGFEMIDRSLLNTMVTRMNARLIIMQYGINVIPNPRSNYKYYERLFTAQLKALKAANPGVSILVIGPSDMSRKKGDQYMSYPNIPLIRDAMKKAAFANGCAFWDLYQAMGGENSMVGWVQNKPPLGNLDYTHFSTQGARYVSEMLYEALILEYEIYKQGLKVAENGHSAP